MKLAKRMSLIKPSVTLSITAKAKALKADGIDVIGFGAGEPDFDTPDVIKRAAVDAIGKGYTKYTAVSGINELKDAIIEKLKRDQGLEYERGNILVSCGAKHSLYNITQALFEVGDEVIIPAPYWVSYPEQISLTGATPVILEAKEADGFKIKAGDLEEAITDKTKGIIINSPSNPTGAAYTKEELKEIADVLKGRDLTIISDDIYEKNVYDGFKFCNIAQLDHSLKEKTIVVNGVSKAYSMTGWRIGYIAGSKDVVKACSMLQSQSTSNPASIAQYAAAAALGCPEEEISDMLTQFGVRRKYIVDALNDIKGVRCLMPQGAFYVFPDVSGCYGKSIDGRTINGSVDLSGYLLENVNVAVIPGAAFGSDNNIRLSYATSLENIKTGVARIKDGLGRLR
jgi:aspartate aminotransferase